MGGQFLIKRTDQGGGYVARPGAEHSYTKSLRQARRFDTREAAERDRCPGNEVVTTIDAEMGGGE